MKTRTSILTLRKSPVDKLLEIILTIPYDANTFAFGERLPIQFLFCLKVNEESD
jgi:hypothetical protein